MRVRRPVALGFLLVVAAAGCGKDQEKKVPSVKDHPDYVPFAEQAYGQGRIVNLFANPTTPPRALEVWLASDTDEFNTKLPEDLAFGQATPWFRGAGAVLIPAGAGSAGERVGSMMFVLPGRELTHVHMGIGAQTGGNFYDAGDGTFQAPVPPTGKASILLYGKPLEAFGEALERRFGTQAFLVGDGRGSCRKGRNNELVGLDGQLVLDVDPGTVGLSLHATGGDGCAGTPLHVFTVDLEAGEAAWAFVYTRDGTELDVLTLPVGSD